MLLSIIFICFLCIWILFYILYTMSSMSRFICINFYSLSSIHCRLLIVLYALYFTHYILNCIPSIIFFCNIPSYYVNLFFMHLYYMRLYSINLLSPCSRSQRQKIDVYQQSKSNYMIFTYEASSLYDLGFATNYYYQLLYQITNYQSQR